MTDWLLALTRIFLPSHATTLGVRTPLETSLLEVLLGSSFVLAGVLFALSIVAYFRRKRRSVLLLVLAFATILGHSLVAVLMLDGFVSNVVHHLVEHSLVIVQSVLVLAAIYYARTVEKRALDDDERPREK